ncbi:MAG TPA: hypothetical protein VHZ31_08175 [Solirubrobacteraceae bacterium]|nr:hypothetical protein [Solirubrobacteraceae bacterium]
MTSQPDTEHSLLLARLDGIAPIVAGACLTLLAQLTWIRRRSEQVTFHDYETARLSSALDIVLPVDVVDLLRIDRADDTEASGMAAMRPKQRIIVPLDVLEKGRLVHFDLMLDGKTASLMNSVEIALITAWMLNLVAIDAGEGPMDQAEFALATTIAGSDIDESRSAFEDLKWRRPTATNLLEEARKYRDNYLLLAELATEERQMIVKYARDTSLGPRLTWAERLGLERPLLQLPLGSVSFGGSYHVEAIVPGELKICGAEIQDRGEVIDATYEMCDRASLYVHPPPRDLHAELLVSVATHRSVLLLPAAIISWIVTLSLLAGGILALLGVIGHSVSGSTGSAVFLAPSIAAGLVLYRTEAPLVRVMLGRARATLATVTAMAFAGGAALAFGIRDVELGATWVGLALIAGTGATILSVAAWKAVAEVPSKASS